ncbi:MAG: glycoside hydrolase family 13 protein [Candidatus Nanopelagicales bacterium]
MPTPDSQWWRSAVIYQIYPKSFADSDGDGFGDLPGITARLGYLADLGVDAIWISPFYRSPQRDGGYDVTDYRAVDPIFGTLADARALIAAAHAHGLRVIIDIVPNHTSDQHRFFQEALATPPGAPPWRRYHALPGRGRDGVEPPNDWFSIFGGSAWDPIVDSAGAETGWWYLHLFDATQPDLNWEHPDVREEFADTLRFWFDAGVDGFRIDVAMALVKAARYPDSGEPAGRRAAISGGTDALPQWDQPGVHEIWRSWRLIADSYDPPRVFVGEVHAATAEQLAPYLRPDELHMGFNFNYLRAPWDAGVLRAVITDSIAASAAVGAPPSWVIENHDFNRARSRLGRVDTAGFSGPPPPPARDDAQGLARARAALLFMLGLPGAVYLYQGQELGLPEVTEIAADQRQDPAFARTAGAEGYRDGCRVPLPWQTSGSAFGFGPDGSQPWLPQPVEWGGLSVSAQEEDPGSTLRLTRAATRLRRAHPALSRGELVWLPSRPDVLMARRQAADDVEVVIALNLGGEPVELQVGEVLAASAPAVSMGAFFTLPADAAVWYVPSP